MKWRPLLLLAGCAWIWLILAYPAYRLDPDWGLAHSAVAALLCVLPTALTLLWCDLVMDGSPENQLAAVFGGTSVRMLFVVCAGMWLYYRVEGFDSSRFWLWVIVFYLVSLTMEMFLVVRRQTALDRAVPKD